MLTDAVKLSLLPMRSQDAESLTLPEPTEELAAAERAYASLKADLAATSKDLETLNLGFDVYGIKRADGTLFPTDGRKDLLAKLYYRQSDLETAERDAWRSLVEARRAFGQSVAHQIKPHIDAICEAAMPHLEKAENLLALLVAFASDVKKSGIQLRNPQVERATHLAQRLYAMRGELAPTPTTGVRR